MTAALPLNDLHLGYRLNVLATSPYAPFYQPEMAELPAHVREAIAVGPVAPEQLPGREQAARLLDPGYQPLETGYCLCPDGAARVYALTTMPGVTPAMWDWWFGWHGCDPQRYKLWHPQSHVHAAWADGLPDEDRYIGRTSRVVEHIGSQRRRFSIRFIRPAEAGLDEARLASQGEAAICARAGLSGLPVDGSWMIHHLRPVPGGCEMRSRFWMSGDNLDLPFLPGAAGKAIGRALGYLVRPSAYDAACLLVHCAQEMNHLAARLPALYAAFGPGR